jgi:uncharacterized phage-associated protein
LAADVREVANAVLEIADREDIVVTNLSLNKLVFFAHAWFLALRDEPLVDSPFEAWQYGPVHPQIHRQLKKFKKQRVRIRLTKIDLNTGADLPVLSSLNSAQMEIVETVVKFYGKYTGAELIDISHEPGAPWDQIWKAGYEQSLPGMIIPDKMIREFYGAKLASRS